MRDELKDEEAHLATNQTIDGQLERAVDNGAAWVLGSAEDLYEILRRLPRQQGRASEVAGLHVFLRALVPQLEELHERLNELVLAAEAWEGRLAGKEPGHVAPHSSADRNASDERGGEA